MITVSVRELKEKYIKALIKHIGMDDSVSVFNSAIELEPWQGDGYEFLLKMIMISDADKERIAKEVCKVK